MDETSITGVRVLDSGGDDLAIVNAARARTGQPPSGLVWVCQHSCSPERISVCEDMNCEAMTTFADADADHLRRLALLGDLEPFDRVMVRLSCPKPLEGAGIRREGEVYTGSLLAFARSSLAGDPGLRQALEAAFWYAGRLLFSQRVVVLEPDPDAVIVLGAQGGWPWQQFAAWGRMTAGGALTLEQGIGRVVETGAAYPLKYWMPTEPGDFRGPGVRLVVRLGRARAQACRELASARVAEGAAFTELVVELLEGLGLPVERVGGEALEQPARLLRALIRRLPI